MARVALSFDAWKDGRVAPATVEVSVRRFDVQVSDQLQTTLKGHQESVWALAFAPDGKTLASATIKGEVKLWDVAAGKERFTLPQPPGEVYSLAFTPDGRTLAVAYFQVDPKQVTGEVQLWDVTTGKEQGTLKHESPRGVTRIGITPDGKTLAAIEVWRENDGKGSKTAVVLWDLAAGKVRATLKGPLHASSLAISPDGKTLALGEQKVWLFDLATGREQATLRGDGKTLFNSLVFAPDGRTLAGGDYRGKVTLWDLATGAEKAQLENGDQYRVCGVAFAPDGGTLAVALGNGRSSVLEPREVVLWDVVRKERRLTLLGHKNQVLGVAFRPDGKMLASSGSDNTVLLWNLGPTTSSRR
jgi:WD40 repeat protein